MGIWTARDRQEFASCNLPPWPAGKVPNTLMCYFAGIELTGNGPPSFTEPYNGHVSIQMTGTCGAWEGHMTTNSSVGRIDWTVGFRVFTLPESYRLWVYHTDPAIDLMFYWLGSTLEVFDFPNQLDQYAYYYNGRCTMGWRELTDDEQGIGQQALILAGERQGKTLTEMYGGDDQYQQFRVARRSDHTRIRVKKEQPESESA